MSRVFFTSDTHFTSERHLELCKRPYSTVKEMDLEMVNNINKVVEKDDILFHLGDFGNYEMVKRIDCNVRLIMGNYEERDIETYFRGDKDKFKKYLLDLGFYDVCDNLETSINGRRVFMAHKPSEIPGSFDNPLDVHLFGHIHGQQRIKKRGINVGVDCNSLAPVPWEDVIFYDKAIKDCYDEEVWLQ